MTLVKAGQNGDVSSFGQACDGDFLVQIHFAAGSSSEDRHRLWDLHYARRRPRNVVVSRRRKDNGLLALDRNASPLIAIDETLDRFVDLTLYVTQWRQLASDRFTS